MSAHDCTAGAYPENDLTTAHQPMGQMAECAIRLLDESRPGASAAQALRELPERLMLRSSA